jgi:hypothetical protein
VPLCVWLRSDADGSADVASAPTLTLTAATSSVSLAGNYTLLMVDADVVGAAANNNTRHWLLNGAALSGTTLSNATADAPEPYVGPGPAAGSGAHRYVLLVYSQPANFTSPAGTATGIVKIDLAQYVQQAGLGPLVAATYMQVENGVSTVSVSATSSVITSTLAAAQSTSSGAKGSGSGSGAAPSATGGAGNGALAVSASGFLLALAGVAAVL